MKKSVYSITLHDEVVRAADRAAYRCGLTRSGLINKILAEHLGLDTPETRQEDFFTEMVRLMTGDEDFLIHSEGKNSPFSVKSSLQFKYNPTIRYSVVLFNDGGEFFGEVRAVLRTQNPNLISELDVFFAMWQKLENAYFGMRLSNFGGGRFVRKLRGTPGTNPEDLGRQVSKYIRLLNSGISAHFSFYPDVNASAAYVSKLYGDYINRNTDIV